MFVTFYSYKGGVGRTLALANLACLMAEDAEHPQRVLVWDFDLEAPGLHRLFPSNRPQKYGFVDFAYEYALSGEVPDINDYIYESAIEGIDVLPAGYIGESYCEKLQKIDWVQFFDSDLNSRGEFFDKVVEGIKERELPYDYVLIDSRTGLNDQAGICTEILSDLLVVLFRLTAQNLDGLEHMIPAIKSQLKLRGREEVKIVPIASQVVSAASHDWKESRKQAQDIFGPDLEYVQFDADLVSREKLFCLDKEIKTMWPCPPIVYDYRRICDSIRSKNIEDTKIQSEKLRRLMREGDLTTAETVMMGLLQKRPTLYQAWNSLEELYWRMSGPRKEESRKIVAKILQDDPKNFWAYQSEAGFKVEKAVDTDSTELLEEAVTLFDEALKHAQENEQADIHRKIAAIRSSQGKLQEAVNAQRKAKELLPNNNQIVLDLAMIRMRMGAKYFAMAAEELDEVSPETGETKYIYLVYLRTYLKEMDKAREAFEQCEASTQPLVEAHMSLISGKSDIALAIAKEKSSCIRSPSEVANWAEFYMCAHDCDNALKLIDKTIESKPETESKYAYVRELVEFFKKHTDTSKDEIKGLLKLWNKEPWNFSELIFFKECCLRDNIKYGNRLNTIEQLIMLKEFQGLSSLTIGHHRRGARNRHRIVQRELFATA